MDAKTTGQSIFAAILSSAMLLVVVVAALTPNFGTVSAQSSCPYGNCTSGSGSSFPWTELFLALAVILAALILAMLAIYYRRRKPPAGDDSKVPGGAGSTGGGTAPPPSTGTMEIGTSAEPGPSYLDAAKFLGTIPPARRKRYQAQLQPGRGRRATRQEVAVLRPTSIPSWLKLKKSVARS